MAGRKDAKLFFRGSNFFRQRIALSILSKKAIQISDIRSNFDKPGIRDSEKDLLVLVNKLSNGTESTICEDGTALTFRPGLLIGGKVEHTCKRVIGYYLELIFMLAPFFKDKVEITLRGTTNSKDDPSVDAFKYGALPILQKFVGVDENLDISIVERATEPNRNGQIVFTCPKLKKDFKPIQFMDCGKMRRIRGIVLSSLSSAKSRNRPTSNPIVAKAKGVFLNFLPDVYLSTDNAGRNCGFGACLVAESTTGVCLTSDIISTARISPEDFGEKAAFHLLEEISRGGCVDSSFQSLVCLYMALQQNDVSQCLLGPLSPYTVQFLRHLKDFFNVTFQLEPQIEHEAGVKHAVPKVAVTCMGVGFPRLP